MKTFQLRAKTYEDVIEWIPFDRLGRITTKIDSGLVKNEVGLGLRIE